MGFIRSARLKTLGVEIRRALRRDVCVLISSAGRASYARLNCLRAGTFISGRARADVGHFSFDATLMRPPPTSSTRRRVLRRGSVRAPPPRNTRFSPAYVIYLRRLTGENSCFRRFRETRPSAPPNRLNAIGADDDMTTMMVMTMTTMMVTVIRGDGEVRCLSR